MWGHTWDWRTSEQAWSGGWGGAAGQWFGSILPRIHHLLPASSVVEIGCGHGRWTSFLGTACDALWAVDVAEPCVAACQERFADDAHVMCVHTDGMSLGPVPDRSVDLVFSFDSLVHADRPVMDAYLAETARVLTDDGTAFLHHSNLGACRTHPRLRRVPPLHRLLARARLVEPDLHWRDHTVSADVVAASAERHGLRCVTQELVPWDTRRELIDCISTVVRVGSARDHGRHVVVNRSFGCEAPALAALASATDGT